MGNVCCFKQAAGDDRAAVKIGISYEMWGFQFQSSICNYETLGRITLLIILTCVVVFYTVLF